VGVVVLLALIWAAVLIPPALQSHAARQEAFMVSLGSTPVAGVPAARDLQAQRIQNRRRIAGGLLVAMAATLLVGLLPTFRVLLIVHLFLVDSFIAYIALLAHGANRAARAAVAQAGPVPSPAPPVAPEKPARRWRRRIVPELGPVAPVG
jgi:predicted lipid-binding transport protein (Tim44 family)